MLEGALKQKKLIGYLAFLVFALCNVFFIFYSGFKASPIGSEWISNLYHSGHFDILNSNLYAMFYGRSNTGFAIDSSAGIRIQAFIAFAYTYHYLNWFSKTEVIKWHLTPRPWIILSVIVWITSIALHLINIQAGILFIATLSLLHVYLEFPLNHRSFQSIGNRLFRMKPI